MNADFILAIGELGKEKGIDPELLFQAVEEALVTAYKKNFGSNQNVRVDMNKVTGELHLSFYNIIDFIARIYFTGFLQRNLIRIVAYLCHNMTLCIYVKQNAAWFSRNFPAERMIS